MMDQTKQLKLKDIWRILNKIRSVIFRVNLNLWEYFRPLDPNNDNLISETKFISVFTGRLKNTLGLSNIEINELTDYFRTPDGRVYYSQFCQIIHDNAPEFSSKPTITGLEWEDPLHVNRISKTELRKLNLIITQIAVNINKRNLILRPYFQDYELVAKNAGTVTVAHFARILNHLGIVLAGDEFKLVVKRFAKDGYTVNYVEFVRAVEEAQNYMDRHGMLSVSGDLLDQFPGRIITAELPKLPRPEIGKKNPHEIFGKQSIFHPAFEEKYQEMPLEEIIMRIQKMVLERRLRIREFFQHFDILNSGRVTKSQFHRGLDAILNSSSGRLYLSENEIQNVIKQYADPNDPDRVLWRVFEDDINHVFTINELEKLPMLQADFPPEQIRELPERGSKNWNHVDFDSRDLCEETLINIRRKAQERQIYLKQFFKNYDKLNHGYVSRNQLRQVLTTATILVSPEEIFALEQRYNDELGFNYLSFLKDIDATPITTPLYKTMLEEMKQLNSEPPQTTPSPNDEDIILIIAKVKAKVIRERVTVIDVLRQYDPRNEQVITINNFIRGLDQLKCNLNRHEINTLINYFKSPLRSEYVDYVRFSNVIEEAITIGFLEKSPLLFPLQHIPSEACPQSFLNYDQRLIISRVLDKLITVYCPNLDEIFKDFDKCNTGTVNKEQLMRALSVRNMLTLLNQTEIDTLYKCFTIERNNNYLMDYRKLLRTLDTLKTNKKYLPF
ncbi:uncharacterized protein LOC130667663 [Microplitis mediator]|uniref:uncharacterized protein LOC130667663 n=1 Tax=Microplitis mediator TaxID=375433 RepID=UPI0025547117|nr:uncharacterized protein LOC130667663 [Microplitis mediator]